MSRATIAVAAVLVALGGVAVAAPVPVERPPDPLARAAVGVVAESNLSITEVYPNMPAAKAGIKVGDKIVRVGGLRPQVFDQVVAHISAYRPGSRIEIEVERAGQRKVFKVTLVPRPESWPTPSGAPISPDD